MKVVVGGPPNSGKSCFTYLGLKGAISCIPNAPYPYILAANPDGKYSWYQGAANRDPEMAEKLKEAAAFPGKYTCKFVRTAAEWVTKSAAELTIIDIGGVPSAENEVICANATHAVLLSRDTDLFSEWRLFCSKLGLKIIAEIESNYNSIEDGTLSLCADGVYRGSIHRLEAGDLTVSTRPTVQALARIIVGMMNKA